MLRVLFSRICLIVCCAFTMALMATVTVHNETDQQLSAGIYYYAPDGIAQLQTAVVPLEPGAYVELEEPAISLLYDRYLIVDTKELDPTLSYEQFKLHTKARIRLPGHYYIASKDGRLKAYTMTEWHVINPIIEGVVRAKHFLELPFMARVILDQPAVQENPYKYTSVTVQSATSLHPQEEAYRAKRKAQVKKTLEKMLGKSLDNKYIPEITMVVSGGGYRAMLFAAGVLSSAQQSGIFDALTYLVTLSGSTWALSYIAFEHLKGRTSIAQSMRELIEKTTRPMAVLTPQEFKLLNDVLLWKSAFGQPMTTVDLWGLFLGNGLFSQYGDERHRMYLSHQVALLADGSFPFPIYTAVPAETTELEKLMYEFTPYEIRAPWGLAVPPYAFGSPFINGTRGMSDFMFAPEQPMSILLGVFGSAYAVSLSRAYKEIEKKLAPNIQEAIDNLKVPKEVGQSRIEAAKFYNFMMGMSESGLKNKKKLKMADAGLGVTGGLPFQPVSGENGRRKADMYIIVDISEHIDNAKGLKKIEKYALTHNLKFPHIGEYANLDRKMISVFADIQDLETPVVIYMPRNKDEAVWNVYKNQPEYEKYQTDLDSFSFDTCIDKQDGQDCTSFNLQYAQDVARKVAFMGEFNMQASTQQIKQAINELIERKSAAQEQATQNKGLS